MRAYRHSINEGTPNDGSLLTHDETRRPFLYAVVGLLLVYFSVAALYTAASPPFFSADESANVGYALSLANGDLPTLETPIPTQRFPELADRLEHDIANGHGHRTTVWTAKHPPLFYALISIPLRLGVELGAPLIGLWAAKAMNVLFGAGVLLAVIALGRALAPTRPQVALIAAGWIAMVPLLLTDSAIGLHNDYLAALTATATIAAALRMLMMGHSWPRLAAVAAWASAAALTRVSGLLFIAAACVIVALAAATVPHVTKLHRLRRLVADPAIVLAAVAITSGWFFWRNTTLYGSLSGLAAARARLGMASNQTLWNVLTSSDFWIEQVAESFLSILVRELERPEPLGVAIEASTPILVSVVLILGVLVALLIFLPTTFAISGFASRLRYQTIGRLRINAALVAPLLICCASTVVVMSAMHATNGGNPHGRYLLQALPLISIAVALAWTKLSGSAPAARIWSALGVALALHLLSWLLMVHVRYGAGDLEGLAAFAPLAPIAVAPAGPAVTALLIFLMLLGSSGYVIGLRACPHHLPPIRRSGVQPDSTPTDGIPTAGADGQQRTGTTRGAPQLRAGPVEQATCQDTESWRCL